MTYPNRPYSPRSVMIVWSLSSPYRGLPREQIVAARVHSGDKATCVEPHRACRPQRLASSSVTRSSLYCQIIASGCMWTLFTRNPGNRLISAGLACRYKTKTDRRAAAFVCSRLRITSAIDSSCRLVEATVSLWADSPPSCEFVLNEGRRNVRFQNLER